MTPWVNPITPAYVDGSSARDNSDANVGESLAEPAPVPATYTRTTSIRPASAAASKSAS